LYFAGGLRSSSHASRMMVAENPDTMSGGINVLLADGNAQFREMRWGNELINANPPAVTRPAYQVNLRNLSLTFMPALDASTIAIAALTRSTSASSPATSGTVDAALRKAISTMTAP